MRVSMKTAMTTAAERAGFASDLILAPRNGLCLDFANTLAFRGTTPQESLHSLADLAQWCATSGAVLAGEVQAIAPWMQRHPGPAAAIFREAIAIREMIYRVFHAVAVGGAPSDEDVALLNRALKDAPARASLQRSGAAFGWRAAKARLSAAALLAPVLWSVGDLLTAPQLKQVRECANSECLWLFLDDSKNRTRRWCSMQVCGNRAKAHRHYIRRKSG